MRAMQIQFNLNGQVLRVWHDWNIALINGQMDSGSFLNPCKFSEELLSEIEEHSLYAVLVPVLWTALDTLN